MLSRNLRPIAVGVLLLFTVLTVAAVISDGPNGFSSAITYNWLSVQIWLDLVIAMWFWAAWVIVDARAHGRSPWVWVATGFVFGAFAPLLYIIIYHRWPASPALETPADSDPMSRRVIGGVLLLILAAVTAAGLLIDGTDVPGVITHSWSNTQIWVDLVLVILLWVPWLINDARAYGRSSWGWIFGAIVFGSFSALAYLIVYGRWPASHPNG